MRQRLAVWLLGVGAALGLGVASAAGVLPEKGGPGKTASETAELPYVVRPIAVPQSLRTQTPIEASGLAWIPELKRFLLVSDDTGFAKSGKRHRPWVFLLDPQGALEARPVELEGVSEVNDLESIAPLDGDRFLLLASQSINKKGKRDVARTELYLTKRQGRSWRVVAKASLFAALERDLSPQERAALGLETGPEPTLNIEASVVVKGALLLGLKEPRGEGGALLWSLKDPEGFLRSGTLAPGQLTLFARLDLGRNGLAGSAFSDLAQSPDGTLFALSTIPNAGKKAQRGGFHRLTPSADGRWRIETLARFPGLKPEGLAFDRPDHAMIVFDEGDASPLFTEVTLPR